MNLVNYRNDFDRHHSIITIDEVLLLLLFGRLTLTADDLDPHAGMTMPADRVKLDVPGDDWVIQVGVFHLVRVHVAVKHLADRRTHP